MCSAGIVSKPLVHKTVCKFPECLTKSLTLTNQHCTTSFGVGLNGRDVENWSKRSKLKSNVLKMSVDGRSRCITDGQIKTDKGPLTNDVFDEVSGH